MTAYNERLNSYDSPIEIIDYIQSEIERMGIKALQGRRYLYNGSILELTANGGLRAVEDAQKGRFWADNYRPTADVSARSIATKTKHALADTLAQIETDFKANPKNRGFRLKPWTVARAFERSGQPISVFKKSPTNAIRNECNH